MTGARMEVEFKVGMDLSDSSSYPELYPEHIFLFINDAVEQIVNEGRDLFEKNQIISDHVKPLVKTGYIPAEEVRDDLYKFDLAELRAQEDADEEDPVLDYRFYLRSQVKVTDGTTTKYVSAKWKQQDDIEVALRDPFNTPVLSEIPITFEDNSIYAYTSTGFEATTLRVTFMKHPAVVSRTIDCDLAPSIHKEVVRRAIRIALENLESARAKTSN